MEPTSKILLHLYGECDDTNELVELLREDEVRLEYEKLGEVKDLLESQPAARPSRQVLENIFGEAARELPEPVGAQQSRGPTAVGERIDRPATPQTARRSLPAYAGTMIALCLLVGLGWWHFSTDGPLLPVEQGEQQATTMESAAGAADEAGVPVARGDDAEATEIPAWDESDDFLRLRRQLQLIEARSSEDGWDESVMPLEMNQGGATMPTLTSAQ